MFGNVTVVGDAMLDLAAVLNLEYLLSASSDATRLGIRCSVVSQIRLWCVYKGAVSLIE